MIRVKLVDGSDLDEDFWQYDENVFLTWPLGGFCEERTEPPFRDPESQLFIREVDHSHLVEGDWYSYVSPFGRTCMSSFAGGTKYALTLIFNSRKGSYTSFENYGEDIWQRLQNLDMDILVAYDPNCLGWSAAAVMPSELRGCIVENVSIGGRVYKEAVYDAEPGENYMDEADVFHFDGDLSDYTWKWGDHLTEIFEHFFRETEQAVLPPVKPTPLLIPKVIHYFPPTREVLCVSDAFVLEGFDKYPRILCLYKNQDGTFTAAESSPNTYPNLYEVVYDVIELWHYGCQGAFYTVIDTGEFFSMESFRRPRLWYFEDDGKTLRVYSGMRGFNGCWNLRTIPGKTAECGLKIIQYNTIGGSCYETEKTHRLSGAGQADRRIGRWVAGGDRVPPRYGKNDFGAGYCPQAGGKSGNKNRYLLL